VAASVRAGRRSDPGRRG